MRCSGQVKTDTLLSNIKPFHGGYNTQQDGLLARVIKAPFSFNPASIIVFPY